MIIHNTSISIYLNLTNYVSISTYYTLMNKVKVRKSKKIRTKSSSNVKIEDRPTLPKYSYLCIHLTGSDS